MLARALQPPPRLRARSPRPTRSTWRRSRRPPDFASFKGRIELVRVPYLRRRTRRAADLRAADLPLAGRAARGPARDSRSPRIWAVLTRLKKPIAERYAGELRELVDELTPLEKLRALRSAARCPTGWRWARPRSCASTPRRSTTRATPTRTTRGGRAPAPAEIKTALFNAAQNPSLPLPHAAGGAGGAGGALPGQDGLRVPAAGGGRRLPRPRGVRAGRGGRRCSTSSTRRSATRWGWSARRSTARSSSATCCTSPTGSRARRSRTASPATTSRPTRRAWWRWRAS